MEIYAVQKASKIFPREHASILTSPKHPNTWPSGFWSLQVTSGLPGIPLSSRVIQGCCNQCPFLIVWPTEKKYPSALPDHPHQVSCSLRVSNFGSTLSSAWDPPQLWWWDLNQSCPRGISSDHGDFQLFVASGKNWSKEPVSS